MTAEELCDRILAEQSMVAEFAEGQKSGWEALLRAIDAPTKRGEVIQFLRQPKNQVDALNDLLGQLQEINDTITDQTLRIEPAGIRKFWRRLPLLEESQHHVEQRIEEIMDQISKSDTPNELRRVPDWRQSWKASQRLPRRLDRWARGLLHDFFDGVLCFEVRRHSEIA